MAQVVKKFKSAAPAARWDELWRRLKVQALPESEKESLFAEMVSAVENRWLRQVSEKLVASGAVKVDDLAFLSQDEKLELVNKYVPDSWEIMLGEINNLRYELQGVVAEEI